MNIDYNFRLVLENKITHYVWIYNTNLGDGGKRFDKIRQGCFTALCSQNNVRATLMLISAMIVLFVTFCSLFEHLSKNLDLWRQYYYMYKSGYWIRHRCLNVSLRHFIPTFVDSLTNQIISNFFVYIKISVENNCFKLDI